LPFEKWIFHNDQPVHDDNRQIGVAMTLTYIILSISREYTLCSLLYNQYISFIFILLNCRCICFICMSTTKLVGLIQSGSHHHLIDN